MSGNTDSRTTTHNDHNAKSTTEKKPTASKEQTGANNRPQSQGTFVFEANTAAFASRKRAAKACVACQKRKKRCPHTFSRSGSGDDLLSPTGSGHDIGVSQHRGVGGKSKGDTIDGGGDGAEKVLPNLIHKEPIRFVGDLNPESILTDLSEMPSGDGERLKKLMRIGTWVEQNTFGRSAEDGENVVGGTGAGNEVAGGGGAGSGRTGNIQSGLLAPDAAKKHLTHGKIADFKRSAVERYSKIDRGRRTLTGHQKNYLQAVGAFRVLPKATEEALVNSYIRTMDTLLPIIDGQRLLKEYNDGEASVFLIQAICMVACKTEETTPHLRLYEDGPIVGAIQFARSLHTGLDAAMKADLEADRFTKVQIMALMSLHNDGPGGIEESSLNLVQAIHDAQTTGMHINTPGRTRNDQTAQLWWTLWMLDKFNACLGGRPVMIAERDIDIAEPEATSEPRIQALMIWMAIGHLLNKVIVFYRPSIDPEATGYEEDFPSWEELTGDCDLASLEKSHQHALELCYNIIGILACRSGGPSTISYNRRITCSNRIQELVSDGRYKELPPIPLIPYSVSLSLTVTYRGLRDLHIESTEAFKNLNIRCEILETLSKTWWTADAMAKLGRKALNSLQQPRQAAGTEARRTPDSGGIGDELAAEVTVCKYGPFDGEKPTEQKSATQSSFWIDLGERSMGSKRNKQQKQATTATAGKGGGKNGNALYVLSDAAAQHGQPGSGTSRQTSKNRPATSAEMNTHNDLQAKRRRLQHSRHQSASGAGPSPPSTANSISNINISSLPETPTLMSSSTGHTPTGHTPNSTTYHEFSNPHSQQVSQRLPKSTTNAMQLNTSPHSHAHLDPFSTSTMIPDYTDPAAFNELDNLFDGFYDLSMPTNFIDPLFDGASFFNGLDDYGGYDPAYDGGFAMIPGPGAGTDAVFEYIGTSAGDSGMMQGGTGQNRLGGTASGIGHLGMGMDMSMGRR